MPEPAPRPPAPRTKEATQRALIEAAASAWAEGGDASVRAIAARAGVNHGLVHHYFGGKEGLRRAVLQDLADRQADAMGNVGDADDPDALATAALAAARSDDRFLRILARTLLDGELPHAMQSAFPVVRRLIDGLQRGGVDDAPTRVAEGLSAVFGWTLFAPWIRAATGLSEAESTQLLDTLIRTHTHGL